MQREVKKTAFQLIYGTSIILNAKLFQHFEFTSISLASCELLWNDLCIASNLTSSKQRKLKIPSIHFYLKSSVYYSSGELTITTKSTCSINFEVEWVEKSKSIEILLICYKWKILIGSNSLPKGTLRLYWIRSGISILIIINDKITWWS